MIPKTLASSIVAQFHQLVSDIQNEIGVWWEENNFFCFAEIDNHFAMKSPGLNIIKLLGYRNSSIFWNKQAGVIDVF
jgi:hypothetical protein